MADRNKKILWILGLGALGYLAYQFLLGSNTQIGGDAGYNRAEIVNPNIVIQSIERPDYAFPSRTRASIVK